MVHKLWIKKYQKFTREKELCWALAISSMLKSSLKIFVKTLLEKGLIDQEKYHEVQSLKKKAFQSFLTNSKK